MAHATPATPGASKLFDQLLATHQIKNDAALSRLLDVMPPVLSKARHGKLPVGASLMIKIHETFDMPIRDIKAALA